MTAVEYLEEKIKKYPILYFLMCLWFDEAKEMEKQQIIDSFNNGFRDNSDYENPKYRDAEQYYNKTYNK